MGSLISSVLKKALRGRNPPLPADSKIETGDSTSPTKLQRSRRRTTDTADTILTDRLGGDR